MKYEIVLIVRFQTDAEKQIDTLNNVLSGFWDEAIEVLVKDIREIKEEGESEE